MIEETKDLLRKSIDDGNGGVSLTRLLVGLGGFSLISTFCFISVLACFYEVKNIDLLKSITMQFGILLTALLAAKVGQSFSEK